MNGNDIVTSLTDMTSTIIYTEPLYMNDNTNNKQENNMRVKEMDIDLQNDCMFND